MPSVLYPDKSFLTFFHSLGPVPEYPAVIPCYMSAGNSGDQAGIVKFAVTGVFFKQALPLRKVEATVQRKRYAKAGRFDLFFVEVIYPTYYAILMVNSYAAILILKLCDLYGNEARIKAEDRRFMDSLSLIYCNYSEKVTIERLAGTALMSRSAYLKKFSEIFGTTPGCLLLDRRITAAKELLSSTQYPLDTIAERTGFYDASHLMRFFIRSEGITPSEYRRSFSANTLETN